jgi:hypothetical protein
LRKALPRAGAAAAAVVAVVQCSSAAAATTHHRQDRLSQPLLLAIRSELGQKCSLDE